MARWPGSNWPIPASTGPNLYSREVPRAVSAGPILTFTADPVQARSLDREDIRDLRRWFRNAFSRSQRAGYDIVCLYGAHGFGIFQHFLSAAPPTSAATNTAAAWKTARASSPR